MNRRHYRFVQLALGALITLGIAACGGGAGSSGTAATPFVVHYAGIGQIQPTTLVQKGMPLGLNVKLANIVDPVKGVSAPKGQRAVAVELQITYEGVAGNANPPDQVSMMAGLYAVITDSDGIQHLPVAQQPDLHGLGSTTFAHELSGTGLNVFVLNKPASGYIVFDVPVKSVPVQLTYAIAGAEGQTPMWNLTG